MIEAVRVHQLRSRNVCVLDEPLRTAPKSTGSGVGGSWANGVIRSVVGTRVCVPAASTTTDVSIVSMAKFGARTTWAVHDWPAATGSVQPVTSIGMVPLARRTENVSGVPPVFVTCSALGALRKNACVGPMSRLVGLTENGGAGWACADR